MISKSTVREINALNCDLSFDFIYNFDREWNRAVDNIKGNKHPVFIFDPENACSLKERDKITIEMYQQGAPLKIIADVLGISYEAVRSRLMILRKSGVIEKRPKGNGGYYD